MALNPKTIKALFGKLNPKHVSDVADVSSDLSRLSKYVSNNPNSNVVKNALQVPFHNPSSWNVAFGGAPLNGDSQGVLSKLADSLSIADDDGGLVRTMKKSALGDFDDAVLTMDSVANRVDAAPLDWEFEPSAPHNNTALGRWFNKHVKDDVAGAVVNYGDDVAKLAKNNGDGLAKLHRRLSRLYDDRIYDIRNSNNIFDELSPGGLDLDDYYRGISFDDDTLPF